jgi:hypothetical protein
MMNAMARRSTFLLGIVATVLAAAPAHADLRYTVTLRVREAPSTANAPASEALQLLQRQVAQALAPQASLVSKVVVTDTATRQEFNGATPRVPAGHVLLTFESGDGALLDPATKAYRRLPAAPPPARQNAPAATARRTGEFSTIAGLRAERVTYTVEVPTPTDLDPRVAAGLPPALTIEGELWIATDVTLPKSASVQTNPAMRAFGLDKLAGTGLVLKQVTRGVLLGNKEVEMLVSDVDRSPVPADLVRIPTEFTENPKLGAPPQAAPPAPPKKPGGH